jgi:hypothetical protein
MNPKNTPKNPKEEWCRACNLYYEFCRCEPKLVDDENGEELCEECFYPVRLCTCLKDL